MYFYKEAALTLWAEEGATLSTEEVFRVPCPIQRRNNFLHGHEQHLLPSESELQYNRVPHKRRGTHIQYGPIAVKASRGEQVMVVSLTVGLSFTLKEVPGTYLLLTVCAHKVFRVPCAAHGSHHLNK